MDTPPLPRRKTIRLQHYDYSQSGAYFVTICTAQRQPLFGKIIPLPSNAVGDPDPPAWNCHHTVKSSRRHGMIFLTTIPVFPLAHLLLCLTISTES